MTAGSYVTPAAVGVRQLTQIYWAFSSRSRSARNHRGSKNTRLQTQSQQHAGSGIVHCFTQRRIKRRGPRQGYGDRGSGRFQARVMDGANGPAD